MVRLSCPACLARANSRATPGPRSGPDPMDRGQRQSLKQSGGTPARRWRGANGGLLAKGSQATTERRRQPKLPFENGRFGGKRGTPPAEPETSVGRLLRLSLETTPAKRRRRRGFR